MRAGDLISDEIPTLEGSDSGLFAMQLLDEYKMKHLPVVEHNRLLGMISDTAVYEIDNHEAPLREMKDHLQQVHVVQDQHVYDLVKAAADFQLSAVPIIDGNGNYVGVVSIYCLVRELARISAINDPGAIIVLEVPQKDYSLSEISQIVESNDARIISANVTSTPDSTKLDVTLKINLNNIEGIIQALNRYEYVVSASYHQAGYDDMMRNRFDELMRYLNT
ncbi:MAG: CBS domain-containing protein [Cryomorphaceae bacterium]|nr:CBS domain-containing protein [Flavobacteriales bacterium]